MDSHTDEDIPTPGDRVWHGERFDVKRYPKPRAWPCNQCDREEVSYSLAWEMPDDCPCAGGYGYMYCSEACLEQGKRELNQPYVLKADRGNRK